ncbi:hypothetical protein OIV36_32085, partial [Burkholderia pseudomallei]|nr:hypothetical protein [Burkholderia pseudomallei]
SMRRSPGKRNHHAHRQGKQQSAVRPCFASQGWPERGDTVARHRVCARRNPRQRRFSWHDQVAEAPPETHAMLSVMHPVGRMGEMSDIVNAILYLDLAPFLTGEIPHMDGGQSAGQ